MIEYHNPEGQVAIEVDPYTLSAKLSGSEAINIGFLANGFPDSESFLHELQQAMRALAPNISVDAYNKGNASMPANDKMIAKIQSECQAVVAAYGH